MARFDGVYSRSVCACEPGCARPATDSSEIFLITKSTRALHVHVHALTRRTHTHTHSRTHKFDIDEIQFCVVVQIAFAAECHTQEVADAFACFPDCFNYIKLSGCVS